MLMGETLPVLALLFGLLKLYMRDDKGDVGAFFLVDNSSSSELPTSVAPPRIPAPLALERLE